MEVISKKNLNKLLAMGFEVKCEMKDFMKLVHKEYSFGITLFCSDERDPFQGVYMSIDDVTGTELKLCKGRNVISNVTRWINNVILK